jgi:Ribose/xylose/arabinose/galactoside ABC-type transport systems, permease components
LKSKKFSIANNQQFWLFIIFITLFVILSILQPKMFLGIYNLQNMTSQLPELGIISFGMMVVIISGGIDLSIISIATISGAIGAFVLTRFSNSTMSFGHSLLITIVGILVIFTVAIICGLINGLIIAKIGVSPIVATLGTMTLFEGAVMYFTKGGAISGFPPPFVSLGNGDVLGIPSVLIIFVIVSLIVGILLNFTSWSRKVYMFGSNPTATFFSGVNTVKLTMSVYVFSAIMAAIAGIIMASRYNSVKVSHGSSYLLESITVVVLGGTSIKGGSGKIIGTIIAVGILQLLKTGFNIIGIDPWIEYVTSGFILILVLIINLNLLKLRKKTVSQN